MNEENQNTNNEEMNRDSVGQNGSGQNDSVVSDADRNHQNQNGADQNPAGQGSVNGNDANETSGSGIRENQSSGDAGQSSGSESANRSADQNSSRQFNFKTPEYGRDNHYGQSQNDNGQNYGQQAPKNPKPEKHSSFARELGHFAAKAAIAAVIGVGALALAGTIALNATNKNVYIVDKNKQVTIGESGDKSSGFSFPFDFGQGNSDGGSGNSGRSKDNNDRDDDDQDDNNENEADDDGPKLGVKVQSVPESLQEAGYPEGVLIAEVTKGGAADQAGLKTGDIITAFNGTVVKSVDELVEQVQDVKAGDTVKVNYKRMENGTYKAYDANVTFSDQTDSSASDSDSTQADSSESAAASDDTASD